MTLQEWTLAVSTELRTAGFEVEEHQGFPLVKAPGSVQEIIRFLKFKTTLAVERRIYAEGCLFVPAGGPT